MKYLLLFLLSVETLAAPARNALQTQEYLYDFSVSGGTSATAIELSAISGKADLPQGAIVKNVHYKVLSTLTSSSNASWTVGFTGDEDGFIDDQNLTSHGQDEAVGNCASSTGDSCWDDTNDSPIDFLVNTASKGNFVIDFSHDITAGKVLLWVEYYMPSLD